MDDLITTVELEHIIEHYDVAKLEDIGKKKWFRAYDLIFKIYRIATIEASKNSHDEERVVKSFTLYNKFNTLVYDLINLWTWKDMVLPLLLTMKPAPSHTFPIYILSYYEIILLGILQCLLFHPNCFDYLENSCMDLVDYAVAKIMRLSKPIDKNKELKTCDIEFIVGTQCIPLLRYICENFDKLPLSVATRIYNTHDVPILVTHLLNNDTWSKHENGKFYKFNENCWKEWFENDPVICKTECQVWLLLRQLLINKTCDTVYYYSSYRKEQMSKLIKLLHENVTDQLSPLIDLKHWLNTLLVTSSAEPQKSNCPLIVDITKNYRESLLNKYEGCWEKIAKERCKILLYAKPDEIKMLAESFSNCYEFMEIINEKTQSCTFCFIKASQKCSKCKKAWYCSRKCQVMHWSAHKKICSSQ